jgi:diguanylate cyclase (GGDEF)-like protein
VSARAAEPHVALFGGAVPEHAEGLERAINVARVVGVGLLAIGILSGQAGSPLVLVLIALIASQSAFVAWTLRGPARWSSRARTVSSVADVLAVGIALFMAADQEPWTHPAAPILSIIVVGLRSGRGGALLAATASAALLLGATAYRASLFGIPTAPATIGSWMTLYSLSALLMSGSLREIGLLRERQRRQHERDTALLDAQSDLGEMLLVTDGEHVLEMNDAARRSAVHVAGGRETFSLDDVFDGEDVARIKARADAGSPVPTEVRLRGRDGAPLELEVAAKSVRRDGGRYILIARDITERKRAEHALERQSLYDPLTALPNRVLVRDRIGQAIASAESDATTMSVLMLDIAHFRDVNEALGFAAGDDLLRAVAARLQACTLATDTVARLGGDEFAMVLHGARDRCERAVDAITTTLQGSFALGGSNVAMDVSIGIARFPEHGADPETLLRHAEFAMYEAKLSGSRIATYAPEHGATAPSQLVAAEVRRAIEADELALFYQPQVAMADGGLVGLEALVRWRHPRLGLLPPSEFVPLIERTAMSRALSDHVLLRAIRDSASWEGALRDTSIAVNLSGRDLLDPALAATVRMFLGPGGRTRPLTVEVTERVLLADPALIRGTVMALGDLGVGFSIDDFGTGGSSLAHLVQLPVAELKIDGSFVAGMRADPKRRAVVRSTIELAHALGSHVVAEGIEDAETWALLTEMRCDAGQGYYIARPMPAEELTKWIATGAWSAPVSARAN